MTRSALGEEGRQEIEQLSSSAMQDLRAEYAEGFEQLRALLAKMDPLLTTAQVAYVHTMAGAGSYYEPTWEGSEAAVEVVASICASQSCPVTGPPDSSDIQQVLDRLKELSDVHLLADLAEAFAAGEDSALLRLEGKVHFRTVRGDSYAHHGEDLSRRILTPVEHMMRPAFGFSIDEFFSVCSAVVDWVHRAVNGHRDSSVDRIESFMAVTKERELDEQEVEEARSAVQNLFDGLPSSMVFTGADISDVCDVGADVVERVLSGLAVEVGSVAPDRFRSATDVPVLWEKPFLRRGEEFVLPVAGILFRSPHSLFEGRLLAQKPKFSKHRADVVDEYAIELLAAVLPGCEAVGGVYYEFDDGEGVRRYETDGVLLFEGFCFVVEGKAGALSVQARRGDTTRLGRDMAKGLESGWKQGARVERFLRSADCAVFTDADGLPVLSVAQSCEREVILVNPLLHPLGPYAFEIPRLSSLGISGDPQFQPWPILITDLRVICEMVRSPAELLHYLAWRRSLGIGEDSAVVDELDVFGAYLFGEVGRKNPDGLTGPLLFGSSTTDFDSFYFGETGAGPPVEKPRRVLGDFLNGTIDDLASRRPNRWLQQSFAILDLPLEEAAAVSGWVERAPSQFAGHRWGWGVLGDTVVVWLAPGVVLTEVMLELAAEVPNAPRRFVLTSENNEPRLVHAERR